MSRAERKARALRRRNEIKGLITEAMEADFRKQVEEKGKGCTVDMQRMFLAGNTVATALVRKRPQEKTIIVQTARDVAALWNTALEEAGHA